MQACDSEGAEADEDVEAYVVVGASEDANSELDSNYDDQEKSEDAKSEQRQVSGNPI